MLTSCLTAVKKHVIKYCEKVYERSGKNLFWSIKNSGEILDKLKARDFNSTILSTYDCSTLYTTLPHNLIKDKLIDLIERTFQRKGCLYLVYRFPAPIDFNKLCREEIAVTEQESFIIYKVMKYRKILNKYNAYLKKLYFIAVKIKKAVLSLQ